jgi:hypothetical protein
MRHLSKFWAQIGDIGGEAGVTLDDILSGRDMRAGDDTQTRSAVPTATQEEDST